MAKSDLASRLQTRQTELDVVLLEVGGLYTWERWQHSGMGCSESKFKLSDLVRDESVKFRNLTIHYPVHSFFARSKISSTVCPS